MEATPQVGSKVSGRVYITSADNGRYWQGWLPGTARHGFKWVTAQVTITEATDDAIYGRIRLGGVDVPVMAISSHWEITRR